jgi:hypothetical protein
MAQVVAQAAVVVFSLHQEHMQMAVQEHLVKVMLAAQLILFLTHLLVLVAVVLVL